MLRSSALYLVIIIALVIGILCSSLIVVAYFYKQQYQQEFRSDQLEANLNSAVNILLGSDDNSFKEEKSVSLLGADNDSVSLKKIPWGIYDIGLSKAYIQHDTIYKAFSIASTLDSTKWAALYLIDEDRPLSVSGNTLIRGQVFIPKAGVKEAYVDGQAYKGDKRIVIGTQHNSEKSLPVLQKNRLDLLQALGTPSKSNDTILPRADSLKVSFFKSGKVVNFKKKVTTITNIKLSGNVILLSDTTIIIENTAKLENVLIFARAILVKDGFAGTCQLFATDSIGVGKNCTFNYPSCLGVIRNHKDKSTQGRIRIGENTTITGTLFTYEKEKSQLQTLIDIANNVKIYGQVYDMGLLKFNKSAEIDGSVFSNRFLYKSTYTTYENYLINIKLDATGLSPYYLTSPLLPVSGKRQKVLQWLEAN
jgi:hypothetical protein